MRKIEKQLFAFIMVTLLLFTSACGTGKESEAVPLSDVTEIPADGIITKEQLKTVAGEDKKFQFIGTSADGTTYTWTINGKLIKNPQNQNLKVETVKDVMDSVKTKMPDAVNAIGLKMEGKGLVAISNLAVTVQELWDAQSASLVKEENGVYTKIAPVVITKDETKGTTMLSMDMTNMETECFIVGTDASGQSEDTIVNTTEDSEEPTEETTTEVEKDTAKATEKNPETTTSKKEETTTSKKEETTTSKKEETTTSKKEETTTEKQEETTEAPKKLTCTISINCATILDNMDKLDPAKKDFVPSDGWILKKTTVTFEQGETVHDVLKRVCREKGIHMESTYTPVYDSAYVEGINQIYEFDCGSESGWMYKVNGWFPNYGSSQYEVSDGDEIAWVYTCDLGDDVGDNSMQ